MAHVITGVHIPRARAYSSVAQSIANTTVTAVLLDSERYDSNAIHSTGSATSRMTANVAGVYQITATVAFAANGTGERHLILRVDGTTNIAYDTRPAAGAANITAMTISTEYQLNANQYVEACVFQNSGGVLLTSAAVAYTPEVTMSLVA